MLAPAASPTTSSVPAPRSTPATRLIRMRPGAGDPGRRPPPRASARAAATRACPPPPGGRRAGGRAPSTCRPPRPGAPTATEDRPRPAPAARQRTVAAFGYLFSRHARASAPVPRHAVSPGRERQGPSRGSRARPPLGRGRRGFGRRHRCRRGQRVRCVPNLGKVTRAGSKAPLHRSPYPTCVTRTSDDPDEKEHPCASQTTCWPPSTGCPRPGGARPLRPALRCLRPGPGPHRGRVGQGHHREVQRLGRRGLQDPGHPHQGGAGRPGQAPPVGPVDRLLQARAPREVPPAARPVLEGHQEGRRGQEDHRRRPWPTSCWPRSPRSTRSSGRPRSSGRSPASRPEPALGCSGSPPPRRMHRPEPSGSAVQLVVIDGRPHTLALSVRPVVQAGQRLLDLVEDVLHVGQRLLGSEPATASRGHGAPPREAVRSCAARMQASSAPVSCLARPASIEGVDSSVVDDGVDLGVAGGSEVGPVVSIPPIVPVEPVPTRRVSPWSPRPEPALPSVPIPPIAWPSWSAPGSWCPASTGSSGRPSSSTRPPPPRPSARQPSPGRGVPPLVLERPPRRRLPLPACHRRLRGGPAGCAGLRRPTPTGRTWPSSAATPPRPSTIWPTGCGSHPTDVVVTTVVEHHANLLPWGRVAERRYVECSAEGTFSVDDVMRGARRRRRPPHCWPSPGPPTSPGGCRPSTPSSTPPTNAASRWSSTPPSWRPTGPSRPAPTTWPSAGTSSTPRSGRGR